MLKREELVELVKKIMNAEGSEEEVNEMINLLKENVPHPEVSNLIFWSKKELTAEEVINEALLYKPIILPLNGNGDIKK